LKPFEQMIQSHCGSTFIPDFLGPWIVSPNSIYGFDWSLCHLFISLSSVFYFISLGPIGQFVTPIFFLLLINYGMIFSRYENWIEKYFEGWKQQHKWRTNQSISHFLLIQIAKQFHIETETFLFWVTPCVFKLLLWLTFKLRFTIYLI
jgi:hypothetical protein